MPSSTRCWTASPEDGTTPTSWSSSTAGVAIRRALDAARPGDVVVVAGKGHETYQEIAGKRVPFDDAVEARRALSVRFGSDPSTWVSGATATTRASRPVTTAPAASATTPGGMPPKA